MGGDGEVCAGGGGPRRGLAGRSADQRSAAGRDESISPGATEERAPVPAPAPMIALPYAETHGWEASRYVGVFPERIVKRIAQTPLKTRIRPLLRRQT